MTVLNIILICVTFASLSLCLGLRLCYSNFLPFHDNYCVRSLKQQVEYALGELQCAVNWEESEGDLVNSFTYQSGHFHLRLDPKNDNVRLSYFFFFDTPLDNIDAVRHICNHCNINLTYGRILYSTNAEKGVVDLHYLATLFLPHRACYDDRHEALDMLKETMAEAFRFQMVFVNRFKETLEEAKGNHVTDMENHVAETERMVFILREQELAVQHLAPGTRQTDGEPLRLGALLDTAMGLNGLQPVCLTVMSPQRGPQEIAAGQALHYDVAEALIADGTFLGASAWMELVYRNPGQQEATSRLTVVLTAAGKGSDTLYYRVTLTRIPGNLDKDHPLGSHDTRTEASSLLVGYDLTSPKQRLDEFTYMWKEGLEKAKAGDYAGMTDEQRLACQCLAPQTARCLYRGRQLFLQKRYLEALSLLEQAYHDIKEAMSKNPRKHQKMFCEVCFLIGFCYNGLHRYAQAGYYLELTLPIRKVGYTQEYVNCMVNGGDIRALDIINDLLSEMAQRQEEEDGDLGELRPYVAFLQRRKAYVLIERRDYDAAETLLRQLLDDPESSDYAIWELAYIQRQRKE